jgi:hypothetical protein
MQRKIVPERFQYHAGSTESTGETGPGQDGVAQSSFGHRHADRKRDSPFVELPETPNGTAPVPSTVH